MLHTHILIILQATGSLVLVVCCWIKAKNNMLENISDVKN